MGKRARADRKPESELSPPSLLPPYHGPGREAAGRHTLFCSIMFLLSHCWMRVPVSREIFCGLPIVVLLLRRGTAGLDGSWVAPARSKMGRVRGRLELYRTMGTWKFPPEPDLIRLFNYFLSSSHGQRWAIFVSGLACRRYRQKAPWSIMRVSSPHAAVLPSVGESGRSRGDDSLKLFTLVCRCCSVPIFREQP